MDALPEQWIWLAGAAVAALLVVGFVLRMVKLFVKLAFVLAVAAAVVWVVETYAAPDGGSVPGTTQELPGPG